MNYGRGFPLPQYGNRPKPIPPENGIGQNQGSWPIPQGTPGRLIPVDDGKESGSWRMAPVRSTAMGNGIVGHQQNGIVQNGENWNPVMPRNPFPQGNGSSSSSSWTPVTPGKPIPQRSNFVTVDKPGNQVENENWGDLIGIYKDLLQQEPLNLNKAAQDLYPTQPPSAAQNIVNQVLVASSANRNSSPIINSNPGPNPSPIPNPNHNSNQPSTSLSCFRSDDPANWNCNLLAAVVRPKKSSASFPSLSGAHNNSVHALNRTPVPNSSTQVGSNSIGPSTVGSMVGNKKSHTFASNKPMGGYNSKQLPTNGFPVPYRPCYNLNSPPRSELDAASSGITGPLPFAPITPDTRRKHTDNQWVPAKDRHESQRNEDADNHYNEQLQTIGDSTSSAVSTTQKEHLASEEGDELGIDLNKTPQQKTPARRKKHRPKVIREKKPKKTATPKDPKNTPSNGTPVKRKYVRKKDVNISESPQGNGVEISPNGVPQSSGKRKYVRKKGVDNSDIKQKTRAEEATAPVVETPAKSCRKQLNFELEVVKDGSQMRGSQQDINLNARPQDVEQERINSILERSAMKITENDRYAGVSTHQESSTNRMQAGTETMSLPKPNVPTPMAKARDHALNVLARNLTMRNSVSGKGYNQVGQHVRGQSGTVSTNRDRREPSGCMVNFEERRGIKRQSFEQMHPRNLNAMDSLLMYQKLLLGADLRTDGSNDLANILESHKKTKTQSDHQTFVSNTPLGNNFSGEIRRTNGVYGNVSALQLLNSCTGRVDPSYKVTNAAGGNVNRHHFQPPMAATQNLQKHPAPSGMQPIAERSQRYTPGHGVNHVTAMVSWNRPPATPPKDYCRSAVVTYPATLLDKKRTATPNSSNRGPNGADKMLLQLRKDALEVHQQSYTKAKGGPRKQKVSVSVSVEDLTYMLEGLCIYDENEKRQNALVPYRGNNAIIPFEPIKKRKPRPKVDLDPETDRLWRLLMGKEGSEATETLNKDKEKWWEDERRVFRGRADSFIARMHLVQGDRRFSRWKGSVVDSVIGVFLTQNVSDHLSSSAFMSLAAKFTPKSTSTNKTCCQDMGCILVEEPIETALPNDSMKCHDKIGRQPVFNQSSFASCESSEHMRHHISTKAAGDKQNRTSEEVILSQDSLDSSTIQTVDEIRSSSGSNSEADDQTTGFETSKEPGPANPMQAEKVSMFKELFSHDNRSTPLNDRSQYMHQLPKTHLRNMQVPINSGANNLNSASRFTPNSSIHLVQEPVASSGRFQMNMTMGLQNEGSQGFGLLRGESISSLPSSKSGVSEAYHTSNVTYQENEMPRFQAPPLGHYNFLGNRPTHQENFQPGPHIGSVLNSNHRQERELYRETTGHAETLARVENGALKQDSCSEDRVSAVDKQNCIENAATEANSKERNYASHDPLSGTGTNIPKAKKGTAEDEKKKAFDWDSLRRQVLSNGEKRERSKDAKDSLDYEALRRAHVNEISNAIRERGMNNLLADRIKDFLDRLVRDHGSVDLEWLRDVSPDKAKEYLLSIRGLGLKSVECVRLLTLHHLAFPVDTNVGRIAVRLGWVPLQPLPESLQLHLLEMYPVLESIQKYLWPRLCKLDQLTLYELHYQMITFGKVFCTKSKPNCNACPMRAECRHFASAFASARLALPGPEEKTIVNSDAPNATDTTPPVISRPMPLPPAENNYNKDAQFSGRECEPIIEEPTTPEPEAAELSYSDIEDQYYEDADEIPTIKLDMDEFTMNLQKMQDSMEGDMSKALVALNPQAASIPTPKLKNVSRLRTEHQVYELPDSHPILEGLNKREPDDPSPYLLAIWTPGETANSMQPPERGCQAQESGILCDRTTCFSCNCIKEANSQVVRGTILMPCRTAMQGSFPLNGTYFQVNEMFADHASSLNPIEVPRAWIWNLPRRTVYFGTSVSTIFKGLTTQEIQQCFWRGFVCVRGFDQKTRAPRPLMARLHFPASKLVKTKNEDK